MGLNRAHTSIISLLTTQMGNERYSGYQKSDIRSQMSEFRCQNSDVRIQMSEFRCQNSDVRIQMSEVRLSVLYPLFSVLCFFYPQLVRVDAITVHL